MSVINNRTLSAEETYRKLRDLKDQVNTAENLADYLRTARHIQTNLRMPFLCLNPIHKDSKPSMGFDEAHARVHCFSCGAVYDLLDLIGEDYGLNRYRDKILKACDLYGVRYDSDLSDGKLPRLAKKQTEKRDEPIVSEPAPEKTYDFTAAIIKANEELLKSPDAVEHFKKRGFTEDDMKKFRLGYCESGMDSIVSEYPEIASQSKYAELYKYIIPALNEDGSCNYFSAEICDRSLMDDYKPKYKNVGSKDNPVKKPLFNEHYITGNDVPETICLCEGQIDALTLEAYDRRAIALLGNSAKRFFQLWDEHKPSANLIICRDNDKAGEEATEKIRPELEKRRIRYRVIVPTHKDVNEDMCDPQTAHILGESIKAAEDDLINSAVEERDALEWEYEKTSVGYQMQSFYDEIERTKITPHISTGYKNLDELLSGGLYKGLYVIGAVSSLGKTSFMLQLMDNVARSGQECILFSLEMGFTELVGRSISRLTYEIAKRDGTPTEYAKSTRNIIDGRQHLTYRKEERDLYGKALAEYESYAKKNIRIYAGVGDIGVKKVREEIENHIRITGRTPLVIVDYLQIMEPFDIRATDKQNTDRAIVELKRISVDYSCPVLVISSFNRTSYTEPVNLSAFKESGAVEYTADVVIGLQYTGMDYNSTETDKTRESRIRGLIKDQENLGRKGREQNIQLKVLKNRNGCKGSSYFRFLPIFNYWREISPADAPISTDDDEDDE